MSGCNPNKKPPREKAAAFSLPIGFRSGKLEVIGPPIPFLIHGKWHHAKYLCRCDCGNAREYPYKVLGDVVSGNKSCGCLKMERAKIKLNSAGSSRHPLYKTLHGMVSRCEDPANQSYARYGGRGIKVCGEWRNNVRSFIAWSLANGYRRGLTIDRIDNDGHYSCGECPQCIASGWPMNCRWTTMKVQGNNRRDTPYLNAFGETKPIQEWAEDPRCHVTYTTLYVRVKKLWPHEEAITRPPTTGEERATTVRITAFGETKTLKGWLQDPRCRVSLNGLRSRLYVEGLDPETAISRPSVRSPKKQ